MLNINLVVSMFFTPSLSLNCCISNHKVSPPKSRSTLPIPCNEHNQIINGIKESKATYWKVDTTRTSLQCGERFEVDQNL